MNTHKSSKALSSTQLLIIFRQETLTKLFLHSKHIVRIDEVLIFYLKEKRGCADNISTFFLCSKPFSRHHLQFSDRDYALKLLISDRSQKVIEDRFCGLTNFCTRQSKTRNKPSLHQLLFRMHFANSLILGHQKNN